MPRFKANWPRSARKLAACIEYDLDVDRVGNRLEVYAHLKVCEDQTNGVYQRMMGRMAQAASRAGQASSSSDRKFSPSRRRRWTSSCKLPNWRLTNSF